MYDPSEVIGSSVRIEIQQDGKAITMPLGVGEYEMPETIWFFPGEQIIRVVFDGTDAFREATWDEVLLFLALACSSYIDREILRSLLDFFETLIKNKEEIIANDMNKIAMASGTYLYFAGLQSPSALQCMTDFFSEQAALNQLKDFLARKKAELGL